MAMRALALAWAFVFVFAVTGCESATPGAETSPRENPPAACRPAADTDRDGIPDGTEGCRAGVDTDRDGTPDWRDADSDGDGIPDSIERGPRDPRGRCAGAPAGRDGWPCDSDGDGLPDYRDADADNDGLLDRDEDRDGDGSLGCCLAACGKPTAAQRRACDLRAGDTTACGPGQRCQAGRCTPVAAFVCARGETDPRKRDTFGDGIADRARGTGACRDASATNPYGRPRLSTATNRDGDWRVAFPEGGVQVVAKVANPQPKMAAAAIDRPGGNAEVAGFVASRGIATADLAAEARTLVERIKRDVSDGSVSVTAAGAPGRTHDGYPAVIGVTLRLSLLRVQRLSVLRDRVLARILGRNVVDLGGLPAASGPTGTSFVVRFTAVRRHGFKRLGGGIVKDAAGFPLDDGDTSKWRLVVIGAVAPASAYAASRPATRALADALSDGTALARASDTLAARCDAAVLSATPEADVIWVIDGTASMRANRAKLAKAIPAAIARATRLGLDVRSCVTNVVNPKGRYARAAGSCCGAPPKDAFDIPPDRFLGAIEAATLKACVLEPPGYEHDQEHGLANARAAITRHLPRGDAPNRLRRGAALMVVVASDEVPASLGTAFTSGRLCTPHPGDRAIVDRVVAPYIALVNGTTNPEARAVVHAITGLCTGGKPPRCGATVGHGYLDLAKATTGRAIDICQTDLGPAVERLFDPLLFGAATRILGRVPVSASLAVAFDRQPLPAGASRGFGYDAAFRRLRFSGVALKRGSRVLAGYHYWTGQDRL